MSDELVDSIIEMYVVYGATIRKIAAETFLEEDIVLDVLKSAGVIR